MSNDYETQVWLDLTTRERKRIQFFNSEEHTSRASVNRIGFYFSLDSSGPWINRSVASWLVQLVCSINHISNSIELERLLHHHRNLSN